MCHSFESHIEILNIQVNGWLCLYKYGCWCFNIYILGLKGHHINRSNEWRTNYHFNARRECRKIWFSFPPPQHVQILSEELCARDRTRLWRSMASPVQLGFQCCQWKSHTVQQEQSRYSAEGSYHSNRLVDVIPFLFPLAHCAHVFQESLSERLQEKNKMPLSDRIKHLSLHLLAWLLSLGLALGSSAGIYFLGTNQELVSSFKV